MSLVKTVEELQKRPLSAEETATLSSFQRQFEISDEDPLIVVLAMMAQNQVIGAKLPDLLQQKVLETIELHRNTLREQSVVIAKELIIEVAKSIQAGAHARKSAIDHWVTHLSGVMFGALLGLGVAYFVVKSYSPVSPATPITAENTNQSAGNVQAPKRNPK